MKKAVMICVALGLLLSACNTVQGAGEDIQSAGQWTANSAQKVKQKIDQQ